MAELLDIIQPRAAAMQSLARDGYQMDWFCFLDVERRTGRRSPRARLLSRLGRLPIGLSLDIYASD